MKQTATEYLVEQLKEYDFSPRENTYLIEIPSWIFKEKVEQAKQIEKEQIKNAWNDGYNRYSGIGDAETFYETFKQEI